jgi:hypothetical protein
MGTILRGLLLGLLATLALPCKGAEISCVDYVTMQNNKKYCSAAFLNGEIVKGDYDKVVSLFARFHPYIDNIYLQSPGGDVIEAIKIGRLLRKYYIDVLSPYHVSSDNYHLLENPSDAESKNDLTHFHNKILSEICKGEGCICASACALIFFGAPMRSGSVGLHRPIIDDPAFKALSPTEAESVYKPALTAISLYLEEMEVPKEFVEVMIATSSHGIRWITSENIKRSPSFAEWADANCGPYDQPFNEWFDVRRREWAQGRPLSSDEQHILNLLDEKLDRIRNCLVDLISANRKKLPPPTLTCNTNDCSVASKSQSRLELAPK